MRIRSLTRPTARRAKSFNRRRSLSARGPRLLMAFPPCARNESPPTFKRQELLSLYLAAPPTIRGPIQGSKSQVFILSGQQHAINLARLGSRSGTTPDHFNFLEFLLHGIACRVSVEEQSMNDVDASKLLHRLVRIEHRAVGVIESMSLDRMPP
jgi:hypothetical protein